MVLSWCARHRGRGSRNHSSASGEHDARSASRGVPNAGTDMTLRSGEHQGQTYPEILLHQMATELQGIRHRSHM